MTIKRLEKVYEGKAKILYATEDPSLMIQYFKDDASAFDGIKNGAIVDKGIVVAGGGSLIKGLDTLLRESTGLPISLASDALSAVALGSGKVLSDPKLLKKVTI